MWFNYTIKLKGYFMNKSLLIASAFLTTLLTAPSFEAEAATERTLCTYKRTLGDPTSPNTVTRRYSGHIQCKGTLEGPQGFYELQSQRHY